MTQNTSFDAFALWKDLYNKTESAWRDVIQETLEKPSFAEGLGQVQQQYVQYQELVNKMTENYLKQANVPSREEIANLAQLIINVDAKIDTLEDQMEEYSEESRNDIDQLKKSVARLEKKLDTVVELVEKSAQQTAATAPVATAQNTAAKKPATAQAK